MVEYLNSLRTSCLEAYTGIIQGLKGDGPRKLFIIHDAELFPEKKDFGVVDGISLMGFLKFISHFRIYCSFGICRWSCISHIVIYPTYWSRFNHN